MLKAFSCLVDTFCKFRTVDSSMSRTGVDFAPQVKIPIMMLEYLFSSVSVGLDNADVDLLNHINFFL